MKYAILNNQGKVVNVVNHDGASRWVAPLGYRAVPCPDDKVGIGYVFDGDSFYATQFRAGRPMVLQLYQTLYPYLIAFSVLSSLTVLIGLGLWVFQLISGEQLDWGRVALFGFLGCWVFPALLIGLGVWVAKLEQAVD